MKIADAMLIGGGMAYTFSSDGQPIGKSLVEDDKSELARRLRSEAQQKKFALLLPVESRRWRGIQGGHRNANCFRLRHTRRLGWAWISVQRPSKPIARKLPRKTIVWNGPWAYSKCPAFAKGTLEIAKAVAAATSAGATSIVGGGDSVAAVHHSGLADKISHISPAARFP